MSQFQVNAISDLAGANGNAITLASDGKCAITGSTITADTGKFTNLPNRNIIICGAMNIAQRGTSSTTSGYSTVDRWNNQWSGTDENCTQAQVDVTSNDPGPWEKGFRKALRITNGNQTSGAGAADYMRIYQAIEAQNLASSGWDYTSASSYITLSFWVKSSVAQTFYGYLLSSDGTSQRYAFSTGALSADTWTKVTKTIPGNSNLQIDNDTGVGMYLFIHPFAGTDTTASGVSLTGWAAHDTSARMPDNTSTWWTTNDATFELTGVQLEVSDYATEFDFRSYGEELRRCQRYFHNSREGEPFGVAGYKSGSEIIGVHWFPVSMRDGPNITGSSFEIRIDGGGRLQNGSGTLSGVRTGLNSYQYKLGGFSGLSSGDGAYTCAHNGGTVEFSAEI